MAYPPAVLFDLDGTLTDPMEGITKSVQIALHKQGIEVADRRALCPFIGPSLFESFQKFFSLDEEQAAQAERDAKYRIWVQAQAEYDRLANQGGGGSVIGDGSVTWPLPGYTRLSSVFGEDRWIWGVADTNHGGVDIPAPAGTPIHVFQSGTVYNSYYSASYGNVVMVDHGGGLVSIYAHMSSRAANVGDVVIVGDVIGYVGSTGQSSGNHLHFETRQNGVRVDPLGYVSPS